MRTPILLLAMVLGSVAAAAHGPSAAAQPLAPAAAGSAPAAPPQRTLRAMVVHVPPMSAAVGDPIELAARIDAPFAETITVRWREIGAQAWHDEPFARGSSGAWYAALPAAAPPGLEYYVRGRDAGGAEVEHFASQRAPHVVEVHRELFERLAMLDLARRHGRREQVALEVFGHNFGNRYGLRDRFIRGELTWTHLLFGRLYHLAFGFGTIDGQTPRASTPTDHTASLDRGLRYGFGEIRVRMHPALFVDARIALGVSQDGFDRAARGVVTFGKPWRACLNVGAETIGDLGATGWVRLQWDTLPPVLMGASVVRTDLPGVAIGAEGLYAAYDVAYSFAGRFTVRAQLSYGPRDGGANFGGGLGTAASF